MADKKISQLTAKGSNLASTDLIPIAEYDGVSAYTTKYVTGSEVVGGAGSTTLYNGDSALSTDRTIDGDGNFLKAIKLKEFSVSVDGPTSGLGVPYVKFTANKATGKDFLQVYNNTDGKEAFRVMADGKIQINSEYTLPATDGSARQVLRTDGLGSVDFVSYGLFSQTADSSAVTNTTTPTSIIGTGEGSLTVPADYFSVGDSFHCNIKGDLSSLNNETLTIEVKSGSVVLASSGAITLPSITSKYFELEIDFTIRAIGGTGVGSIVTSGEFNYVQNSGNAFEGAMFHSLNNTTFNTTISNTLDVLVTWGSASASNSIKSHITNLRRIY